MTSQTQQTIGIIAGGGQFPLLFAEAAKKQGHRVVVIAHQGESSPKLAAVADRLHWIRLGQLGKMIKLLHQDEVKKAVLIGCITKTNIFRDVRPDLKGLAMWNRMDTRQDDAILRAVATELEHEDIRVVASTHLVPELLFPRGTLSATRPTAAQRQDIEFGWRIAKQIGALDIGQCVVVRDQVVLAVEAIEGTDATIRRGGQLGKEHVVVVKIRKPRQDVRFDLPAVGLATIESMLVVRASVLAVEAGQALLFDGDAVIKAADKAGIVLIGIEDSDGALTF